RLEEMRHEPKILLNLFVNSLQLGIRRSLLDFIYVGHCAPLAQFLTLYTTMRVDPESLTKVIPRPRSSRLMASTDTNPKRQLYIRRRALFGCPGRKIITEC